MQVPAPFEYERASSVDDAIALLERHGEEARLIAGGHSILPLMKLRFASPEVLVDINDLAELQRIWVEGDLLCIGAMVRHADLLASAVVGEHYQILHDAERVIADPVVRNRGTVGGSLCHADPAEDLSAALGAIRADVVIKGSGGERLVPVRELQTGPFETILGPAEMVTEIRLPIRPGTGSAYTKVERRAGDYAIAAAGAVVQRRDSCWDAIGTWWSLCSKSARRKCGERASLCDIRLSMRPRRRRSRSLLRLLPSSHRPSSASIAAGRFPPPG